MATSHRLGAHSLTVDGETAEFVIVGPLALPESTAMHAHLADMLAASGGRGYLLVDITRLSGVGPDVRRQISAWNADHRLDACALFGGSFAMRAILTLAVKAIRFRDSNQLDVLFARDEAEARAWLAAQRARRGPR